MQATGPTLFHKIHPLLVDSDAATTREAVAKLATMVQTAAVGVGIIASVCLLPHAVGLLSGSFVSTMQLSFDIAMLLACHDLYQVAKSMESLFKPFSLKRQAIARWFNTPESFADPLVENTCLKPILKECLVTFLNQNL